MKIMMSCACGKRFWAKPELIGRKVKCPGCNIIHVVEGRTSTGVHEIDEQGTRVEPVVPSSAAKERKAPINLGLLGVALLGVAWLLAVAS